MFTKIGSKCVRETITEYLKGLSLGVVYGNDKLEIVPNRDGFPKEFMSSFLFKSKENLKLENEDDMIKEAVLVDNSGNVIYVVQRRELASNVKKVSIQVRIP